MLTCWWGLCVRVCLACRIDEDERQDIIRHSCPGAGACGGMYTANTMATAIEALGLSLPYSSSNPAISDAKVRECLDAGKAIKVLLEKDIKPRDILTRQAFDNAIVSALFIWGRVLLSLSGPLTSFVINQAVVMALGGSTNAVLHLIAIARAVGIPLTIDDIEEISERVPLLADFKPSGAYFMEDIHK